jgi:hypothetical protein
MHNKIKFRNLKKKNYGHLVSKLPALYENLAELEKQFDQVPK